MKRRIAMILSMVLILCLMGCGQGKDDVVNNEVFTNAFLKDVVEIRFDTDEPVTGEQMQAVFRYLKSLHLEHSEEEIKERDPGTVTYGGWDNTTMEFEKSDGTVLKIRINQWAMSGLPGGSYHVENPTEVIERGGKSLLRSIWEACGRDPEAYPYFS